MVDAQVLPRIVGDRAGIPPGTAIQGEQGREPPVENLKFHRAAGWTEEQLETYCSRHGHRGEMIYQMPQSYRRLEDGAVPRIGQTDWRIMTGRGHSPEHACLFDPKSRLFISGDQILPRISSNVSVLPIEPEGDPLGDRLDSIAKIKNQTPDDVMVLPGHNQPFVGLHRRLDELVRGDRDALDRLRQFLEQPRRVVDTFEFLFSRNVAADPGQLELATGESLAHLNYLPRRNEAVVAGESDGAVLYVRRPA